MDGEGRQSKFWNFGDFGIFEGLSGGDVCRERDKGVRFLCTGWVSGVVVKELGELGG